jgi:3,4-dihydroxy 2-butanone 4-phosphate synthase/GTP cyclohydrolase II
MNLPLDRDLEEPLPGFARIADALADLAAGKFLVVLDDEDRENEGDLIIAADKVRARALGQQGHGGGAVHIVLAQSRSAAN